MAILSPTGGGDALYLPSFFHAWGQNPGGNFFNWPAFWAPKIGVLLASKSQVERHI